MLVQGLEPCARFDIVRAHQAHPAGIERRVEGGHEIRDVGQYAEGREA